VGDTSAAAPIAAEASSQRGRLLKPLGSADFRKLWVANNLSLIGDFFSYVALAWLVLQLTGSSLALGGVLVAQAVPRSLLMLVGGRPPTGCRPASRCSAQWACGSQWSARSPASS
jgi:hypothetical protein